MIFCTFFNVGKPIQADSGGREERKPQCSMPKILALIQHPRPHPHTYPIGFNRPTNNILHFYFILCFITILATLVKIKIKKY